MIDHQVDSVVESLPLPRDRQASGIDRIEKCASGIRQAEPRGDTAGRMTVGVESWRRMLRGLGLGADKVVAVSKRRTGLEGQKLSCHGMILCLALKGEILC